jgi:hypothetical protein
MASTAVSADRQWLRACTLVVGGGSAGLDLSQLRIKFATHKGDVETPNNADITVYNLAPETLSRIRGEFKRVVLSAGYSGNCGVIFDGQIRQVRTRTEGADTLTEITVADGDRAYNFATVSATLAAGVRPAGQIAAAAAAMADKDTALGYLPDLAGQALPRGKVIWGMARKVLRDVTQSTDASWSIQSGLLQVLPGTGYLPGADVVLTSATGLIGSPEQTNDGIKARCLINPRLKIGGRVKLDNASIQTVKADLKLGAFDKSAKLDRDGWYRILKAEFLGDTRGSDWYADLLCIGLDDTSHMPLDRI